MKTINLNDYYDHIGIDTYIDVPDEVFNTFEEYRKAEQAYQSRIRYHKEYYSLDRGDGIEHSALFVGQKYARLNVPCCCNSDDC